MFAINEFEVRYFDGGTIINNLAINSSSETAKVI